MPTFNSVEALKAHIAQRAQVAVNNVREQIYDVIKRCLDRYYGYNPSVYQRTMQLMNSLVTVSRGDGMSFEIYFDSTALSYDTGSWSTEKILEVDMEEHSHGGYVTAGDNTAIWVDSIDEIGDVLALVKKELVAAGLPVK